MTPGMPLERSKMPQDAPGTIQGRKAGRPPKDVTERFWKQVTKTETCWTVNGFRYGKIKTPPPEKRTVSAHRFSWELHFGLVPPGKLVCHRCNNKLCIRPDHLYLADCKTNINDAIKDGLKPRWNGQRNPTNKLTPEQVATILASKESANTLAVRYGVWNTTIWNIRSGKTWKEASHA